ncbi:hypothetical protein SG34_002955 [Thalassomonas viridans]|uniref:Peptidase family M49 n=1 Tax=Thalassomonas viridans TaxID=137584 RepID=A0AAF0C812_9GAMM|nr:hypothetical protein [Thalassomonas viridans]WDE05907.1 hypothetical protein SG34_002955 [Thalassomonas viridans]
MKKTLLALSLSVAATLSNQAGASDNHKLDRYLAQYSPYKMTYDASHFSDKDKLILKKLVKAAELLDEVYWQQTSKYGRELRDALELVPESGQAQKLLTLLKRNGAPFEQLNNNQAFMGHQEYYPGQEFYPRGLSAASLDNYMKTLSKEEQAEFMNPYTVIQEDGKGGYRAVRYYQAYKKLLDPVIDLLNEVADLTDNASFAKFLRLKARALITDEYFDADVAWLDLTGNKFDIVFGPFETYDDGIKGVKAKYQAYIEVVDKAESEKLDLYTQYLQEMEDNLPIPEQYRSVVGGLTTKFVVVRDIIRTGMAIVGYQAVATNLPNDPAVHKLKGTKKTFWKNMFEARFNGIIKPVSQVLINKQQLPEISDDGFFQFVLMHEISHALGPRTVKVGSKKGMATNAAIGPNYNALEEAKADISGMHSLIYLMDKGIVDAKRRNNFFISYLGSLFRSMRFGLNQAHGKAAVLSLNYFAENGGVSYDKNSGRWTLNDKKFEENIASLAKALLILEGDGDNSKVQAFFDRWAVNSPRIQASLDKVNHLPIDVLPEYSIKWD